MSTQQEPPNWPTSIEYLITYEWAPSIPYHVKYGYFCLDPEGPPEDEIPTRKVTRSGTSPVEIRILDNPDHPACGERGLFATKRIPPFSWILDYIGVINLTASIPPERTYTLSYHGPLSIDASERGNQGRCINDWTGIATRPNADFDVYRDAVSHEVRTGVWSLNQWIEIGDEILAVYGGEFWGDNDGRRRWDPEWDAGEEEHLREQAAVQVNSDVKEL
ncbi:hypothetical protein DFJ77DRAFT_513524 [Powellomyces hirtus]|nr:hypothetical protein DFJ77DRAFT_513524 [Powellomyces hirtus]